MERDSVCDLMRSAGNCAVFEMLLHWMPWNRALGDELQPPITYVIGMLPIVVYSLDWAGRRRRLGWIEYMAGLLFHLVLAGLAVTGSYALDAYWADRNERMARGGGVGGTRRRLD